jgi:hypothetical protein
MRRVFILETGVGQGRVYVCDDEEDLMRFPTSYHPKAAGGFVYTFDRLACSSSSSKIPHGWPEHHIFNYFACRLCSRPTTGAWAILVQQRLSNYNPTQPMLIQLGLCQINTAGCVPDQQPGPRPVHGGEHNGTQPTQPLLMRFSFVLFVACRLCSRAATRAWASPRW